MGGGIRRTGAGRKTLRPEPEPETPGRFCEILSLFAAINSGMKKILGLVLPVFLAVLLLWLAYRDTDFTKLAQQASGVRILPVLATFATTLVAHWLRALRWNMLFEPIGYRPPAFNSFLAVMSGYFANLLIPRAGEVSRCTVLFTLNRVPIQSGIGTVIAERGLDLAMLLLISLLAFGLEYETLTHFLETMQNRYSQGSGGGVPWKWLAAGLAAGTLVVVYLFRDFFMRIPLVRRIWEFAVGLLDGLLSATRLRNPVLFFVYTVSIWACYFLTTYISLSMFDFSADLGFRAAFMLLIVGSFGIVIPVPGVVGGPFQLFVAAALTGIYGKDAAMSTTASSMMYWTQTLLTLVAGGICYLITLTKATSRTT
jgi:uncharacterized membrane protein YbhN (UPF0104 family)